MEKIKYAEAIKIITESLKEASRIIKQLKRGYLIKYRDLETNTLKIEYTIDKEDLQEELKYFIQLSNYYKVEKVYKIEL